MFPLQSHPPGINRNSTLLVSNESPYFSHFNPQISASNSLNLEVIAEKVTLSGVPILIFLCIFVTTSPACPVSHTYFCPRRESKKSNHEVKLCKSVLGVIVNQFRLKNIHVKMDTTLFNLVLVTF